MAPSLLSPIPRPPGRFPWWGVAVALATAAVLVALRATGLRTGAEPDTVLGSSLTAAAILSCAVPVGMWIETAVAYLLALRGGERRVIGTLAFPPVALAGGFVGGSLLGAPLALLGDEGTAGLAVFASLAWASSAGVGTLIVIVLDGLAARIARGFRARIALEAVRPG